MNGFKSESRILLKVARWVLIRKCMYTLFLYRISSHQKKMPHWHIETMCMYMKNVRSKVITDLGSQ